MGWNEVKPGRRVGANSEPFIAIRAKHISFSSAFINQNKLNDKERVKVLIDDQGHKVGFDFDSKDNGSTYKITRPKGIVSGSISAAGLVPHKWVVQGRFAVKKEGNLFVITVKGEKVEA